MGSIGCYLHFWKCSDAAGIHVSGFLLSIFGSMRCVFKLFKLYFSSHVMFVFEMLIFLILVCIIVFLDEVCGAWIHDFLCINYVVVHYVCDLDGEISIICSFYNNLMT